MLPPEIGLLTDLIIINLQSNYLQTLPIEIGALTNLRSMNLSRNQIGQLPHEICLLPHLMLLNMSHNDLKELPESIGIISNLRTLIISHNRLERLPPSFNKLLYLRDLDVSSNRFVSIDKETCLGLQSLENLNYSCNLLRLLPREVLMMRSICQLNLRQNRLEALPLGFSRFTNMLGQPVEADVSRNPLSYFPLSVRPPQISDDPSNSFHSLLKWMEDEELFYEEAVAEWFARAHQFLACHLKFEDFYRSVLERVKNSTRTPEVHNHLRSDFYINRIKQFYFASKKAGSPPVYEEQSEVEEKRRRDRAQSLQLMRNDLATVAKEEDMRRREKLNEIYFGNFENRCHDASLKCIQSEEKKNAASRELHKSLIREVNEKIHTKEMTREASRVVLKGKASQEVEMLNKISFQKHSNRKRTFPVEIDPCWKENDKLC